MQPKNLSLFGSGELKQMEDINKVISGAMNAPKKKGLTVEMANCIAFAKQHANFLQRYQGGFWTCAGCPVDRDGVPRNIWFGTCTIKALVDRDIFFYSDYLDGRYGLYGVRVELKPEYITEKK